MPALQHGVGGGFREKIHVIEGGDAAAQHFGTGQQGSGANEAASACLASAGQMCSESQRIKGRSSA
jgi:hypothetical protein